MKAEKARELFSEYRDGTLSPSLRTALETALGSDTRLSTEYKEFDELLGTLELEGQRSIDAPFDLHERIMARIDRSVLDRKHRQPAGWLSGWRLAFAGGLFVLVVGSTVVSIVSNNAKQAITPMIPVSQESRLSLRAKDGVARIQHGPANIIVDVKDVETGQLVKRFDLRGRSLDSALSNDQDMAVLLDIESGSDSVLIAVPGKLGSASLEGKGTLRDLAKAAADRFREPVAMKVSDAGAPVSWTLNPADPAHSKAVEGHFSFDRMDGLLYLGD